MRAACWRSSPPVRPREVLRPPCNVLRARYPAIRGGTRYYTPEIHRAAFTLPPCFDRQPPTKECVNVENLETGS
jgi:spermidine synthase